MRSVLGIAVALLVSMSFSGCRSKDSVSKPASACSADGDKGVRALYEEYKTRDLANDPTIMDLYADDSSIALSGAVYKKDQYAEFVKKQYQDHGAVNKNTEYGDISVQDVDANRAEASFTAMLKSSNMNVYWMLSRDKKSQWQIQSESFGFGGASH